MSSNIYEDPILAVNVGCRGGGERLERRVDIYESGDADRRGWTSDRVSDAERKQQRERQTRSRDLRSGLEPGSLQPGLSLSGLKPIHRNLLGAAVLVLVLLCVLLITAVILLSRLNVSVTLERDELQSQIKQLQMRNEQPSNWTKNPGWTVCYYISTEKKNWTESRTDCQSRGADLVVINNKEEQGFLSHLKNGGSAWIGLRKVKKDQWDQDPDWKWVDGSLGQYMGWGKDVNRILKEDSSAFLDTNGTVNHAKVGSKHWICEKQMF